ncbi:hypothetical protein B0H14DRAFT_2561101 [Mycena olivaceomarginata]|nr:hypothetical protein B0H14DRAFT_2561101 [Mycena olivaceomarginata]
MRCGDELVGSRCRASNPPATTPKVMAVQNISKRPRKFILIHSVKTELTSSFSGASRINQSRKDIRTKPKASSLNLNILLPSSCGRARDSQKEKYMKEASKIRKFSYLSRVTGVEYENRQNVTKSLKITPKIEISAYTVARAVAFARAAFVDSIGLIGVFNPIYRLWYMLFKISWCFPTKVCTEILGMSRSPEAKYEN